MTLSAVAGALNFVSGDVFEIVETVKHRYRTARLQVHRSGHPQLTVLLTGTKGLRHGRGTDPTG
jgi:hypothetical protein